MTLERLRSVLNEQGILFLIAADMDQLQPDATESAKNIGLWHIDGKHCVTTSRLLTEWAQTLHFPQYFGGNWDAFEECVADLGWLPFESHVFLVSDAVSLLALGRDMPTLMEILRSAGIHWEKFHPGHVYKVFLTGSKQDCQQLQEALREAGLEFTRIA